MNSLLAVAQQIGHLSTSVFQDLTALVLALIFGAVFLCVLAGGGFFTTSNRAERRLSEGIGVAGGSTSHDLELVSFWNQTLNVLEKRLGSVRDSERSKLRTRMMQAGYFSTNAVRVYYFLRLLLAVSLFGALLLISPLLSREMPVEKLLLFCAMIGLFGLYAPTFWISMRISRMQQSIKESFPDALDMLTVCVEAGLGLDAAFNRVGTQIARAHPSLSYQFALVSIELRAGKSREDALRNFAMRVGVPEVKSFVTLLVQSEALGTSIAETLRIHAAEMRMKRTLKAEEKAHKLPVKLSVVLVVFILPALMSVILLPAIIRIARTLIPALTG